MPRKTPIQSPIKNMDGVYDKCAAVEGGPRQIDRTQWKNGLRVFADLLNSDENAENAFNRYRQNRRKKTK